MSDLPPLRAFVGEDGKYIRKQLVGQLEEQGFQVVHADSGQLAAFALSAMFGGSQPPDIVILDNLMGEGPCGLEILGSLRAQGYTGPAIIQSGGISAAPIAAKLEAVFFEKGTATFFADIRECVADFFPGRVKE